MTTETIHTCSYAQRDELAARLTVEANNARGEVVAWFPTNAQGEIIRNYGDGSPVYACRTKEEAEQAKRCHLGATGPVIPLYTAPSPSALGGADEAVAILLEAYDFGQFSDDFDQPLARPVRQAIRSLLDHIAQQPAAPSGAVNVVGMPEFDGLMDHIYEYGTTAEGVVERANAFARAVLAQYAPRQPAAVDEDYPTPRNRAEAVALARLALAHLGVIDAHIDAAIARCETNSAAQTGGVE